MFVGGGGGGGEQIHNAVFSVCTCSLTIVVPAPIGLGLQLVPCNCIMHAVTLFVVKY